MSKATIVYISTFILLGAGLWAVLAFGHGLTAPPDVSGYWQVRPVGTEVPVVGDGLEIEQSGKYLRLRMSTGRPADLKLVESLERNPATGMPTLRFTGDGMELTIEGMPKTDRTRMWKLSGPADVTFDARRTVYQGKLVAKEPAPATAPRTPQPLTVSPTDPIDASER